MRQHINIVLMAALCTLITSCGNGYGYANIVVYNKSDYTVSDIQLYIGSNDPEPFELEPEAHYSYTAEWGGEPASMSHIQYTLNGKQYGVKQEEGVLVGDTGVYFSPQLVKDGADVSFYIKNESYQLIIKGGAYFNPPGSSPDPNNHGPGSTISDQP